MASSRTIWRATLCTLISMARSGRAYRVTERVRHMYERLQRTVGLDVQRLWFDILYVQRYNACLRPH